MQYKIQNCVVKRIASVVYSQVLYSSAGIDAQENVEILSLNTVIVGYWQ